MSIGAASIPAVASEGALAPVGNETSTDIATMVLAACVARKEFLQDRTADKVRDVEKLNEDLRQVREILLDLKNHKPDGMAFYGLSEKTMEYLSAHPNLIPEGVSTKLGADVRRYMVLEEKEKNGTISVAEASELKKLREQFPVCGKSPASEAKRAKETGVLPGGTVEYEEDFDDLIQKVEQQIKNDTSEAQSKTVGLQATLRAGEQMMTLISSVIEKSDKSYRKAMNVG